MSKKFKHKKGKDKSAKKHKKHSIRKRHHQQNGDEDCVI